MAEDVRTQMDMAAAEAEAEFRKLMAKPTAKATDLVAFHQKWYLKAGHKRLGALYRDYSGG
jgi:hypothetical protein